MVIRKIPIKSNSHISTHRMNPPVEGIGNHAPIPELYIPNVFNKGVKGIVRMYAGISKMPPIMTGNCILNMFKISSDKPTKAI